jgi:hypothetical protein
MLCCFGACYYKNYLRIKERKEIETQTEPQTEPQTASIETDVVQIRTVEHPRQVKNTFKRSSFTGHGRP